MFSLTYLIIMEVLLGICSLGMIVAAVLATTVYYERKLARLRSEFEAIAGRDAWVAVAGLDFDQTDAGVDQGPLRRLALHIAHAHDG